MRLYKFNVTVNGEKTLLLDYIEIGNSEEEAKLRVLKKLIETELDIPNQIADFDDICVLTYDNEKHISIVIESEENFWT